MPGNRRKIRVALRALEKLGPEGHDAAAEIEQVLSEVSPKDVRFALPQKVDPKPVTGEAGWFWRGNADGSVTFVLLGPKGGTLNVGTVS